MIRLTQFELDRLILRIEELNVYRHPNEIGNNYLLSPEIFAKTLDALRELQEIKNNYQKGKDNENFILRKTRKSNQKDQK